MRESRTRVNFGLVNEMVVPILLGTTYIDRFMNLIHPTERRIVLHHSPLILILMVCKAKSETKNNDTEKRQRNEEELTLLGTPISDEPNCITVARQVVLTAIREIPVVVFIKAAGPIEVVPHDSVAKNHICMTARASWTYT